MRYQFLTNEEILLNDIMLFVKANLYQGFVYNFVFTIIALLLVVKTTFVKKRCKRIRYKATKVFVVSFLKSIFMLLLIVNWPVENEILMIYLGFLLLLRGVFPHMEITGWVLL